MDTLERTDLDIDLMIEEVPADECEAIHEGCSVTPVALGDCRCLEGRSILVCKAIVDWAYAGAARGAKCGDCDRPLLECWIFVHLS